MPKIKAPNLNGAGTPNVQTEGINESNTRQGKGPLEMNFTVHGTTDNPQNKIVPCPVLWCVGTADCHGPNTEDHDPRTRMHESEASNLEGCGYLTKVQTGDAGTATGYVEFRIVTGPAGHSAERLRALADKFERIAKEFVIAAAGIDLINADQIARLCDADNSSPRDRALYTVPPGGPDMTSTTATSGIAPCPSWCVALADADDVDHSDPRTRLHQSGGAIVKDVAFLCIVQKGDSADSEVYFELTVPLEEVGHTPEQARTRSDELKHIAAELAAYADCVEEINADNSTSSERV